MTIMLRSLPRSIISPIYSIAIWLLCCLISVQCHIFRASSEGLNPSPKPNDFNKIIIAPTLLRIDGTNKGYSVSSLVASSVPPFHPLMSTFSSSEAPPRVHSPASILSSLEGDYPTTLTLSFTIEGVEYHADLERNDSLFSEEYKEQHIFVPDTSEGSINHSEYQPFNRNAGLSRYSTHSHESRREVHTPAHVVSSATIPTPFLLDAKPELVATEGTEGTEGSRPHLPSEHISVPTRPGSIPFGNLLETLSLPFKDPILAALSKLFTTLPEVDHESLYVTTAYFNGTVTTTRLEETAMDVEDFEADSAIPESEHLRVNTFSTLGSAKPVPPLPVLPPRLSHTFVVDASVARDLSVENTTLRGNNCQYQGIVRRASASAATSNQKDSNPSRSAISFCNDSLEGVVMVDNTPYVLSQKLEAKDHEQNTGSAENGLGSFNTSTPPFLRLPLHTLEPLQSAYNAHQALLAQLIPQSSHAASSASSPSPHPTVTSTVLSSGSSEIGCHVLSKKPEDIFTPNELLRGRQDLLDHFHEILQTSGRGISQRAFSPLSQGTVASVMNTFTTARTATTARAAGVGPEKALDTEFEAILRQFDAEATSQAEGFIASDSSRDDTAAFSLHDLFRGIRGRRDEDENIPSANPSETHAGGPLRRLIDPRESSTKYVELHIVTDYKRYSELGSAKLALRSAARIANIVDTLYSYNSFRPPVRIVLVGQTLIERDDAGPVPELRAHPESPKILQVVNVEGYLERFLRWANTVPATRADAKALLSGYSFTGKVVGMAMVGAVCTPAGGSVIQALVQSTEAMVAVILAHETGHVLGMKHDGDDAEVDGIQCPLSGYLMAPTAPGPVSRFSECSKAQFRNFLKKNNYVLLCLSNVPRKVFSEGECGNGIVESGEICDCGGTNPDSCDGIDPCCNPQTCRLRSGPAFQCSAQQPCCTDTCTIIPRSEKKICRPSRHSTCDRAEYCDGASANCPIDIYTEVGETCYVSLSSNDPPTFLNIRTADEDSSERTIRDSEEIPRPAPGPNILPHAEPIGFPFPGNSFGIPLPIPTPLSPNPMAPGGRERERGISTFSAENRDNNTEEHEISSSLFSTNFMTRNHRFETSSFKLSTREVKEEQTTTEGETKDVTTTVATARVDGVCFQGDCISQNIWCMKAQRAVEGYGPYAEKEDNWVGCPAQISTSEMCQVPSCTTFGVAKASGNNRNATLSSCFLPMHLNQSFVASPEHLPCLDAHGICITGDCIDKKYIETPSRSPNVRWMNYIASICLLILAVMLVTWIFYVCLNACCGSSRYTYVMQQQALQAQARRRAAGRDGNNIQMGRM